ncbi:MAG: hypothetical protein LBI36_04460, partial [Oscillospiraceae bacterium]|nr:hypothetical protein [Oscillospiraceae bacterium]
MFEYLFGRYLVNTGKITQEKLFELFERIDAESRLKENTRGDDEALYDEIERADAAVKRKLSELVAEYDAPAASP